MYDSLTSLLNRLRHNQNGSASIEYALIAGVISIGTVSGASVFEEDLTRMYNTIGTQIGFTTRTGTQIPGPTTGIQTGGGGGPQLVVDPVSELYPTTEVITEQIDFNGGGPQLVIDPVPGPYQPTGPSVIIEGININGGGHQLVIDPVPEPFPTNELIDIAVQIDFNGGGPQLVIDPVAEPFPTTEFIDITPAEIDFGGGGPQLVIDPVAEPFPTTEFIDITPAEIDFGGGGPQLVIDPVAEPSPTTELIDIPVQIDFAGGGPQLVIDPVAEQNIFAPYTREELIQIPPLVLHYSTASNPVASSPYPDYVPIGAWDADDGFTPEKRLTLYVDPIKLPFITHIFTTVSDRESAPVAPDETEGWIKVGQWDVNPRYGGFDSFGREGVAQGTRMALWVKLIETTSDRRLIGLKTLVGNDNHEVPHEKSIEGYEAWSLWDSGSLGYSDNGETGSGQMGLYVKWDKCPTGAGCTTTN